MATKTKKSAFDKVEQTEKKGNPAFEKARSTTPEGKQAIRESFIARLTDDMGADKARAFLKWFATDGYIGGYKELGKLLYATGKGYNEQDNPTAPKGKKGKESNEVSELRAEMDELKAMIRALAGANVGK